MSAQTLNLSLGKQGYNIVIDGGLLMKAAEHLQPVLPGKRIIILADSAIAEAYVPPLAQSLTQSGFSCEQITLEGGEQSKKISGYESLMNQLLSLTPDRKTTLIALGGGVIGDLVGFAASTLLRGVPFVQIPTTLLAQVDSSVGGKTGINTRHGKNLIGAFYQPKCVLIDTDTLNSLPERQMRAGYAEIVKYAALGDVAFFDWLEEHGEAVLARESEALAYAIHHCCRMKATIVSQDEREQKQRALLNLGHTFGHALEAEAGYDGSLLHGEAVAIGMVMATNLSKRLGLMDDAAEKRITAHLRHVGLPATPADIKGVSWSVDAICSHFAQDKKAQDGKLVFVVLRALGDAELLNAVSPEIARQTVAHYVDNSA